MATARHLASGMTADAQGNLAASTSHQIVNAPGWVFAIGCTGDGAAGSLVLVDSKTLDTPVKWRLTAASGVTVSIPFDPPIRCATGVRLTTAATTLGSISYKAE